MENAEINALVKIIGLKYKQKYQSVDDMKTLRYGRLMIMTDQDHDGSHIKGLIINFIHHNWPSLLQQKFLEEFITPIVKVTKGKETISFYSLPEMEEWKKGSANWKTYHIKYYKGLGTSTSKEAKEYFSDMARHRILFKYNGSSDDDQITMAFSKKCVELRKEWLTNWMEGCKRRKELGLAEDIIYSSTVKAITFSEFINKELVLFSNLDNERSIPCLVDGLKPGQRKVLYTCFKRNDKREVKVAQLAGSVAEHSAYHHGEQSLMSTIVNLAQNYVGSNNINLLQPIGQFGTRLQGGKDSASPRYIFTKLSPLARFIFDSYDDAILKSLYDDNQKIEPEWYCPIIPMVLVNGADGIGTGWMTKCPNFNPRDLIQNLRRMIRGDEPQHMKPWYKNFRGEIIEITPQKYAVNGEVSILSNEQIEITELPIATWTQSYKEGVVEPMLIGTEKVPAVLTDYKEYHTDTTVKFVCQMKEDTLSKFEERGLHQAFKLQSVIGLTSMVLFDQNGCIKRYESALEILQEFFTLRMEMYRKRKEYLMGALSAEALKLTNQARFIVEKCDGSLVVENKKRKLMIQEMVTRKYDSDPVKIWKTRQAALEQRPEDDVETPEGEEEPEEGRDFEYLLGMPMWSLTQERKEDLLKKRDAKQLEVAILKKKSPSDLYNDDLDRLMLELEKWEKQEEEDNKEVKKSVVSKKGFNKKAELAAAPSPKGEKVRPRIDDLIKKVELATKSKQNKGKKAVKKEEGEEKDEFDLLADDDENLRDKLNSSAEGGPSSKAKPKKAPAPKKNGTSSDGLKQTKLNFGKSAATKLEPKVKPGAGSGSGGSGSGSESDFDIEFDDFDSEYESRKKKKVCNINFLGFYYSYSYILT
jgi:DNA topoisomerase-2